MADDFLAIDTPENVVFGYELAGIGSRLLAALIDSTLIGLLIGAVVLVGSIGAVLVGEALARLLVALLVLLVFVVFWGYYIFFETAWNGQTPGKRFIGLRVMRSDGTPVSLTEVAIRNLIRIIDFLPGAYGVGVLVMFFQPQSRRLGDLAAGTLVVFDRTGVALPAPPSRDLQRPTDAALIAELTALPLERLTPAELRMVDDFLERRWALTNSDELARTIVTQVYARLAGQPPAGLNRHGYVERLQGLVYLARHLELADEMRRAADAAQAGPAAGADDDRPVATAQDGDHG